MGEDKQIWQSTTVQGAVVSFIALIGVLAKVDLSQQSVTAAVSGAFGLIGIIMTIVGRLKANRNLTIGSYKL